MVPRSGDLAGLGGVPGDALRPAPIRDALATFRACTGRSVPPSDPVHEAWLIVGRRGGKSFVLALIAVFLACFREWRPFLQPGERATVMIIAADRRQARVIMRYVKALFQGVPMLAQIVQNDTQESVELSNAVTIEVHTASFRTVRGYSICALLADEIAFWRTDDSANPDTEILAAIRPAMATVPGAMLLCASSPYARRGALYQAWRTYYGKDGPVLVWQSPTKVMNPTVPERVIKEAYERDPASAAAEYGAKFRSDVESFVSREAVAACVVDDRHELPPVPGVRYVGFVDPSGGSQDSMTLGISHMQKNVAVLDAVRERKPPFSPDAVVVEFAELLKQYRIGAVRGDAYAGGWVRERFREHGIDYRPAGKPKPDIYRDILPSLNSGRLELLDLPRLITQIVSLERRTARGGRDSIDHPPGAHDDLCNAALGALWAVSSIQKKHGPWIRSLEDDVPVKGIWFPHRPGLLSDW